MPIASTTQPGQTPIRRVTVIDAAWVLFIAGAGWAFTATGIEKTERYFWILVDGALVLGILARPAAFAASLKSQATILTWPLIAILSASWSLAPFVSAYHGLQLFATLAAGALFCITVPQEKIVKIVFAASLLCLLASLAYVFARPDRGITWSGEWRGVYAHKNSFGSMLSLCILTSTCLFLGGWKRPLTGAAAVLAAYLLVKSRSGTALIALLAGLSVIPLVGLFHGSTARLCQNLGLVLAASAIAIVLLQISGTDPVDAVFSGLGKDRTLTGRTILWNYGTDAFYSSPIVGLGYKGYWEGPFPTMLSLRYEIGQSLWFFHNTVLEVAVAFGVFGPVLLAAGIASALAKSVRFVAEKPSYTRVWPLSFLIYVTVYAMAENPLFDNHNLLQFLFMVAAVMSSPQPQPAAFQPTLTLRHAGAA